jgi:hypothetical protein
MKNKLNEEIIGFNFLQEFSTNEIHFYKKELGNSELCELRVTFIPQKVHFEITYDMKNRYPGISYEYSGEINENKLLQLFEAYLKDSKKITYAS